MPAPTPPADAQPVDLPRLTVAPQRIFSALNTAAEASKSEAFVSFWRENSQHLYSWFLRSLRELEALPQVPAKPKYNVAQQIDMRKHELSILTDLYKFHGGQISVTGNPSHLWHDDQLQKISAKLEKLGADAD